MIKIWTNQFKKRLSSILVIGFIAGAVGCSGGVKKESIGENFNINIVSLTLLQQITPSITYHSEPELQRLLTKHIRKNLTLQGMFSTKPSANMLNIKVVYRRHFLDEINPTSSGALAYPIYDFDINVMQGHNKRDVLANVSQQGLLFKGRYIMNIDVEAGRLDKKSDEIVFIDGIAKEIVRSIQTLK
ncbi:MAG: hypothetical protein L3J00_01095 [Thiomicrorhabdus sp.]|nr:hypothetical protein [Thiomicrorhabdus sp.]